MPEPSTKISLRTCACAILLPAGTLRVSYNAVADHRTAADRDPSQNRRVGINHDVIFNRGMTGVPFHQRPVFVDLKAFSLLA